MAEIRCPMCSKLNPEELEVCQFCGARLKPLLASAPSDSQPIKAGEQPTPRDTSEFERVKPSAEEPIHAGEAPTKKSTSELEQALPSWLRSLRQGGETIGEESAGEGGADQELPFAGEQESPAGASEKEVSDWLAGLSKAAAEEEEAVPDWLAELRGGKKAELTPQPETIPSHIAGGTDWFSRLGSEGGQPPEAGGESQAGPAEEAAGAPPSPGEERLPDWLSGLSAVPAEESPPSSFEEKAPPGEGEPPAEELPDWLKLLKEESAAAETLPPASKAPETGGESLPDWLSGLGAETGTSGAAAPGAGNLPDWLTNLEAQSAVEPPAEQPAEEALPDWLSGMELRPGSGTPAILPDEGEPAAIEEAIPDWLAQFQTGVSESAQAGKAEEAAFEIAAEGAAPAEAENLPEWLAGMESTPSPGGTPALVLPEEEEALEPTEQAASALEVPEWLSKLRPEETAEKAIEGEEASPEALEAAELPSWVQAMRPMESIVAEAKTTPLGESQVVETSGPLAGLQGVLPADPGLGPLRKPPPYSVKLQVTEGQRRYAAQLERLVASEAEPKPAPKARLKPSQLWRLLVASVLILLAGISLTPAMQIAPDTRINPTDKPSTIQLLDGATPNSPVLVIVDYDPALSGELEAAAAPIMARLLERGAKAAMLSTNPTGPALAEQFLRSTQSQYLENGKPYVNLGYLAGGASGVLYFAASPTQAAGNAAIWKAFAEMRGVQDSADFKLSDFALILILTDNADTSRNWVEQARPYLDYRGTPLDYSDDTPILMVISAQAEPMIRPYFDSGQIQGLVTGLIGAKVYEQEFARPGLGQRYWNAFNVGTLTAVLLIICGAIWGAITGRRASNAVHQERGRP